MKKILNIISVLFLLIIAVSCSKEEHLTTSGKDIISKYLDLDNPFVKGMYDKYEVELYTEFDSVNIIYNMLSTTKQDMWSDFDIGYLKEDNYDFALEKLDKMVFSYFTKDYLRSKLHHRYFLVNDVTYNRSGDIPDPIAQECSYGEKSYGTVIYTDYSAILAFDREHLEDLDIENDQKSLNKITGVKLYATLCNIIEKHDLYKEIPDAFYDPVEEFHGTLVSDLAKLVSAPIGEDRYKYNYKPDWYIGLGMVITANSPKVRANSDYGKVILIDDEKAFFPDKERDFRNFMNVIFCEIPGTHTVNNIETYYKNSPIFKERMKIVLELLDKWGVDYKRINPALEDAFLK